MSATRFVCFGELLLRLASPGRERLLQSPRLEVQVGGAEANVAVALAQFGHAAALIGTVADNALGAAAVGEVRRHGVDVSRVQTGAGRMGLYFLETGAVHRPSHVLYDRAGSAFALASPERYDWSSLLDGVDVLHVSGVTPAVGANAAAAATAAVRAARARGLSVVFDGNYRSKLWQAWNSSPGPILRDIFACADVVFADHRDIAIVLGREFVFAACGLELSLLLERLRFLEMRSRRGHQRPLERDLVIRIVGRFLHRGPVKGNRLVQVAFLTGRVAFTKRLARRASCRQRDDDRKRTQPFQSCFHRAPTVVSTLAAR